MERFCAQINDRFLLSLLCCSEMRQTEPSPPGAGWHWRICQSIPERIRLEVQQIQNDIVELNNVNYQAWNKTSYQEASKRDSNSIGWVLKAGVKQLHMINALRVDLEAQRGSSNPTARIARAQYQCLSNALQEVMLNYNDRDEPQRGS